MAIGASVLTPGQARTGVGWSRSASSPGSARRAVIERPCMSRDVIIAAGPIRPEIRAPKRRAAKLVEDHRHFEHRGATEIVDENDVRAVSGFSRQPVDHHFDRVRRAAEFELLDPRLPAYPKAKLKHACRDAVFFRRAGNGAGPERNSDTAEAGDDAPCGLGDGRKVGAVGDIAPAIL